MPFPREETTPPVTKTYLVMLYLVWEILILQERKVLEAVKSIDESRREALPQPLGGRGEGRGPHHRPVAPAVPLRGGDHFLGRSHGRGDPRDARAGRAPDRRLRGLRHRARRLPRPLRRIDLEGLGVAAGHA